MYHGFTPCVKRPLDSPPERGVASTACGWHVGFILHCRRVGDGDGAAARGGLRGVRRRRLSRHRSRLPPGARAGVLHGCRRRDLRVAVEARCDLVDLRCPRTAAGRMRRGSAETFELLAPGPRPWQLVAELRARFARRCADVCTTIGRAGLVAALGVGDRSLLPPEIEIDLAASGLVHLLASSGLHLAVITLLVRWVARRLWLRTPWAARIRSTAFAAVCAAPAVAAEVLLLGAPWPAVRAGMGAGLALCADVLGRRTDGLTALFAAAAGCALLDPAATHDLALQLSVAGVAGMLVLAEPVRDFFPRPLPRIPLPRRAGDLASRVAEHGLRLACATGAAILCTAPLLAAAFHRASLT